MSEPIVSISNVVKTYPGFRLEMPELNLSKGHLHCLIGPNGAGKSTLLRMLIGLSLPDKGNIELFDMKMPDDEAQIKLRTAYIAAEMGFPSHMTAASAIDYVERYYPEWSQAERFRLVEAFDVPEKRKYVKLSTGQKMRTLLVTAFARGADLLLLDEPFASLDPLGKDTLKEELMDYLLDENRTVLLATNELYDIEDIIDYIHIISNGRIVASSAPDELCATVSRFTFKGSRRGMQLKKGLRHRVYFKGDTGVAVVGNGNEAEINLLRDAGARDLKPEEVTLKDVIRYYFAMESRDAA
jgi:ABC-2 type transport system ATP-binding protein